MITSKTKYVKQCQNCMYNKTVTYKRLKSCTYNEFEMFFISLPMPCTFYLYPYERKVQRK